MSCAAPPRRERNAMNDTIAGNLHVANDVLADMVGNAALECYGVVGMAAPNERAMKYSAGTPGSVSPGSGTKPKRP